MTGMPRLSEDLTHERRPDRCASCGKDAETLDLWIEADNWDQFDRKSPRIMLCVDCSRRIIEPHARLYSQEPRLAPIAGAMRLCVDCSHRDGLRCNNPASLVNGGPGIEITGPRPSDVHLNYGSKGGRWTKLYPGPPTACSGRKESTDAL